MKTSCHIGHTLYSSLCGFAVHGCDEFVGFGRPWDIANRCIPFLSGSPGCAVPVVPLFGIYQFCNEDKEI